MEKEVVWTKEAIVKFEEVVLFLLENWSEKEVNYLISRTEKVIEFICLHPNMFRMSSKIRIREALITPHNLMFYRVKRNQIQILTFWDTRQNPVKKPKK